MTNNRYMYFIYLFSLYEISPHSQCQMASLRWGLHFNWFGLSTQINYHQGNVATYFLGWYRVYLLTFCKDVGMGIIHYYINLIKSRGEQNQEARLPWQREMSFSPRYCRILRYYESFGWHWSIQELSQSFQSVIKIKTSQFSLLFY